MTIQHAIQSKFRWIELFDFVEVWYSIICCLHDYKGFAYYFCLQYCTYLINYRSHQQNIPLLDSRIRNKYEIPRTEKCNSLMANYMPCNNVPSRSGQEVVHTFIYSICVILTLLCLYILIITRIRWFKHCVILKTG